MPNLERPNHETSKERVEHTAPGEQRPRDQRINAATQRALGGTALDGATKRDRSDKERDLGRVAMRKRDRSR